MRFARTVSEYTYRRDAGRMRLDAQRAGGGSFIDSRVHYGNAA
jgi:hypothetical protein